MPEEQQINEMAKAVQDATGQGTAVADNPPAPVTPRVPAATSVAGYQTGTTHGGSNTVTQQTSVSDSTTAATGERSGVSGQQIDYNRLPADVRRRLEEFVEDPKKSPYTSVADIFAKTKEPSPDDMERHQRNARRKAVASQVLGALQSLVDVGVLHAGGNVYKRDKYNLDKVAAQEQAAKDRYDAAVRKWQDDLNHAKAKDAERSNNLLDKVLGTAFQSYNQGTDSRVSATHGTAANQGRSQARETRQQYLDDKEYNAALGQRYGGGGGKSNPKDTVFSMRNLDGTYTTVEIPGREYDDVVSAVSKSVTRDKKLMGELASEYNLPEDDLRAVLEGDKVAKTADGREVDRDNIVRNVWYRTDNGRSRVEAAIGYKLPQVKNAVVKQTPTGVRYELPVENVGVSAPQAAPVQAVQTATPAEQGEKKKKYKGSMLD